MALRKTLFGGAAAGLALLLAAAPALAGVVTLRPEPVDHDGRITLGDLFEGAGSAADVAVGARAGATAVLDAGQVQALARAAGVQWTNPTGLRRIVVRQGAAPSASAPAPAAGAARTSAATVEVLTYARNLASGEVVGPQDVIWTTVQAHQAPAGAPGDAAEVIGLEARRPLRAGAAVAGRDLTAPQVIERNTMVQVEFNAGGVHLTLTGRAQQNAAVGEPFSVLNVQSGRTIQAVAVAPGRAVAGPAALAARAAAPSDFAALR